MTSTSWSDALDAMEERVQLAKALLELSGDGSSVPAFDPPAVTGPLPADLAARAQTLRDQGEDLQRRMAEEAGKIRTELQRLPRMPTGERQPSKLNIQA